MIDITENQEYKYTEDQLSPTTECDSCGKTGSINSTNYDSVRDQILCPECDSLEV